MLAKCRDGSVIVEVGAHLRSLVATPPLHAAILPVVLWGRLYMFARIMLILPPEFVLYPRKRSYAPFKHIMRTKVLSQQLEQLSSSNLSSCPAAAGHIVQ